MDTGLTQTDTNRNTALNDANVAPYLCELETVSYCISLYKDVVFADCYAAPMWPNKSIITGLNKCFSCLFLTILEP